MPDACLSSCKDVNDALAARLILDLEDQKKSLSSRMLCSLRSDSVVISCTHWLALHSTQRGAPRTGKRIRPRRTKICSLDLSRGSPKNDKDFALSLYGALLTLHALSLFRSRRTRRLPLTHCFGKKSLWKKRRKHIEEHAESYSSTVNTTQSTVFQRRTETCCRCPSQSGRGPTTTLM